MTAEPAAPTTRPTAVIGLLALAVAIGVVVSLGAWGFLEGTHQLRVLVFDDLPGDLGFATVPWWWPLGAAAAGAVVTALAIARLPGRGGHVPADGLKTGITEPVALPGVILAAAATLSLGVVLGPEAPLIALGSGIGVAAVRRARRGAPDEAVTLLGAVGSFAALAFVFDSPVIAAVVLLEATGLDRLRMPMLLAAGLLGAGIGSLVSIGMGSWTGLSTSAYALGPLPLPVLDRPTAAEIGWTIPLAALIGIGAVLIFRTARALAVPAGRRPFGVLALIALAVGALAILFDQVTGKGTEQVLFSGQDQLPGLVTAAPHWSVGTILLLLACKGVAYSVSLGGFRGGPVFPALFLGAAAGIAASGLPGMSLTAGVAAGMGAGAAAALRLPLSALVLAVLLTAQSGAGAQPVAIVAVVVAYLVAVGLSRRLTPPAGAAPSSATKIAS